MTETKMDEKESLRAYDNIACDFLNSLRNNHKMGIADACHIVSIIWGRLRKSGQEVGVSPQEMDKELMFQAEIYTRALQLDNEPEEPSEDHQKCLHCGEYQDECECDGGLYD